MLESPNLERVEHDEHQRRHIAKRWEQYPRSQAELYLGSDVF